VIEKFVRESLAEDVGRGDLYALVEPSVAVRGHIIAKSDAVLAGVAYVDMLAQKVDPFEIVWRVGEGEAYRAGEVIATFEGESHTMLRVERTMLNILHHASGIATLTRRFVELCAPYGVRVLDTRKTRPMLRVFEKYASRIGGAVNHRMGLDDALMLKDTHLKTIPNLKAYIDKARTQIPFTTTIEVEAETVQGAIDAMQAGADIVMCDNMTPDMVREVVAYRNAHYAHIRLEASGNISLATVEAYAQTGIDAISTGSTIHQAVWPDMSMKIDG